MPIRLTKKRAPTRSAEQELWAAGYDVVVGVDEVGRGAWAGPLMVGAAVLPRARRVNGVRDSKMLTEAEREKLFGRVAGWCSAWAVGVATREECDELGMAPAQKLAAQRAIEGLGVTPDAAVVDGRWNFVGTVVPYVDRRVKADALCLSVAAASILAKVTRDRYMRQEAEHYPHWSFDTNKGYPCPVHKAALQGYGPSAIHRRTWIFMDHYVPWPGLRVIRPEQPALFSEPAADLARTAREIVESHTYGEPADLQAIKEVLRTGRIEAPTAGHWHPGEIDWWFFYGPERLARTTIWSDLDGAAGWVLVDREARSADAGTRPDLRGSPAEAEMVAHAERELGDGPVTLFASGLDEARRTLLTSLGYQLGDPAFQVFAQPLADPVDVPALPEGFRLLDEVTDEWVAERAECHRRAFDPSRMTPERYHAFREAPDYDARLDVAVASDDGRIVAYAMAWVDEPSRSGQLEPVGTRPHFWRRGLGRAANLEALRRMQERGVEIAGVNTWAGHASNIPFYESCGFERTTTIDRFVRPA